MFGVIDGLDVITPVFTDYYLGIIREWYECICDSKLNDGMEIDRGLFAITVTIDNHKRLSNNSLIIKQTNVVIKNFMRLRIKELDKKYNADSIFCYELSPFKLRPHLHGIVRCYDKLNIRDYIVELEQLFGIVKVKLPFYTNPIFNEDGNDINDWVKYFSKGKNYLDKRYFDT